MRTETIKALITELYNTWRMKIALVKWWFIYEVQIKRKKVIDWNIWGKTFNMVILDEWIKK